MPTATTATPTASADAAPLLPILARKVREVEAKSAKGKVSPANRTRFQVIALLVREERNRVRESADLSVPARQELLKRLDGIATILARIAARDTSVLTLLESDSQPSPAAQRMRVEWLIDSGAELSAEDLEIQQPQPRTDEPISQELAARQVTPPQIAQRLKKQIPFIQPQLPPDLPQTPSGRLMGWELMEPLYRSFETGAGGGSACMPLPPVPRWDHISPRGFELMKHQIQFLGSVMLGHRSFLLADEPGLGKTAQALLAASVAQAYPMVAVVPNVVKINWAREVQQWTPHRTVSVIEGDGDNVDAYADVYVINYEILDRHLAWLMKIGLNGFVVDEAHFIKNLSSRRSQNVLTLADHIRQHARIQPPLMMALTGTPLINDVEDFEAIWRFLGWIDEDGPTPVLLQKLQDLNLTPAERDFYPQARSAVIDLGIVRRQKTDVAKDLPERRIADIPVELEGEVGRSIRQAEQELGQRLALKYRQLATSRGIGPSQLDMDLLRQVATSELEGSRANSRSENVFTMVRKIGTAKAALSVDYTVQLARSVGKVVFFAKHVDVMDQAERLIAEAGLKSVSIRGEQTAKARQAAIDDFTNDPEVQVVICSLTAAGVGLNLHVASNVVLAELSWTAAEQGQAIDRVHRIGQENPVTAWRILAAHTLDITIAELIDSKRGLAARALDGDDSDIADSTSVQIETLVRLTVQALEAALAKSY